MRTEVSLGYALRHDGTAMNDESQARPDPTLEVVPPLAPFANPTFRVMWFTWFAANTSMLMNDVASAWLMTKLSASPVMVALVATASTLPVFLLGLPCGAIADIVDRRRWFMFTQVWVAVTATLLFLVSASGALDPTLLLVLVFANGIGLAMRWPVFAAIIPEVVPRRELSAALALNGVSMNLSRIVGPIVAGALIASVGTHAVYALNAVLSVMATVAIWRWRNEPRVSALPGERFLGAIRVGWVYVRQSPGIRVVLARVFAFFLQSAALTALLPLTARRLDGGAGTFTLLLASMGAGAIVAALSLGRVRTRFDRDAVLNAGSVVHALATAAVAWAGHLWLAVPAMVVAGAAWISVANSLTLSAQLALPDWVRARAMAIFQMCLMGGAASGAALWGYLASVSSVPVSMTVAAGVALLLLLFLRRYKVQPNPGPELNAHQPIAQPSTALEIAPDAGPIQVTMEYLIDEADVPAFVRLMEETRRSRLRLGALTWGLFRDTANPRRFVEYYVDENWTEHLRHFDRASEADVRLRDQRRALHRGDTAPQAQRLVGQSLKE